MLSSDVYTQIIDWMLVCVSLRVVSSVLTLKCGARAGACHERAAISEVAQRAVLCPDWLRDNPPTGIYKTGLLRAGTQVEVMVSALCLNGYYHNRPI